MRTTTFRLAVAGTAFYVAYRAPEAYDRAKIISGKDNATWWDVGTQVWEGLRWSQETPLRESAPPELRQLERQKFVACILPANPDLTDMNDCKNVLVDYHCVAARNVDPNNKQLADAAARAKSLCRFSLLSNHTESQGQACTRAVKEMQQLAKAIALTMK